jgi:hypothetical protein
VGTVLATMGDSVREHPRLAAGARVTIVVWVLLFGLGASQRSESNPAPPCSWGASSVHAEVVDGKLKTSEPVTSGCVPR